MLSKEDKKAIEFLEMQLSTKAEKGYYKVMHEEYTQTVLNLVTKLQKENEHQIERRNNQKAELAILNEKQKEMNKLINDVKTYRGQFKRQEKDIQKYKYLYQKALDNTVKADKENIQLKKQIDLMGEVIFRRFTAQLVIEYGIENKEQFINEFEKLAKDKGE